MQPDTLDFETITLEEASEEFKVPLKTLNRNRGKQVPSRQRLRTYKPNHQIVLTTRYDMIEWLRKREV